VYLDKHTTGDGIVSALLVLDALKEAGITLAAAVADMKMYPQILINVALKARFDFASHGGVQKAVAEAERDLDGSGRVLLRASGTEPLIRVMVEGTVESKVKRWAETIAEAVRSAT
jgi:phosphoglucosamine mutase